ncbi:hypothetical protein ACLB2K_068087 [Fragaria x ananassa]
MNEKVTQLQIKLVHVAFVMKGPKPRNNNNNRKTPPRYDDTVSWSRFFWCTFFVFFNLLLLSGFTFDLHLPSPLRRVVAKMAKCTQTAVTVDSPIIISVREPASLQATAVLQRLCKTPLSVLTRSKRGVKVSVRLKGRKMVDTISRPGLRSGLVEPPWNKEHVMCIMLHGEEPGSVLEGMGDVPYMLKWECNVGLFTTTIVMMKLMLLLRCYRVGTTILPGTCGLGSRPRRQPGSAIARCRHITCCARNQSMYGYVGEVRTLCYSFGPSGLRSVLVQGVTVGYTCCVTAPERHKSILKPEALDLTLMNEVHHFHLGSGYEPVNADTGLLVIINHYKYQVWEVFKEKFYRRVATYVADWQERSRTWVPRIELRGWGRRRAFAMAGGLSKTCEEKGDEKETEKEKKA